MAIDTSINTLIVDDDKATLHSIRNLLKQIDFEKLKEVNDGKLALEKLQANNFGLVISNWNIEPMTELNLLADFG